MHGHERAREPRAGEPLPSRKPPQRRFRRSTPGNETVAIGPADIGWIGPALDEAVDGRGRVFLVQSDGGVFPAAVAAYARRRAIPMLSSRCEPDVAALDAWLRLAPELGGTSETGDEQSVAARFGRFAGVARMLEAIAHERPCIVLLQDVHHADRSSLLLLECLAHAVPAWPVAVIATYADVAPSAGGPFADALSELAAEPIFEHIGPGGVGSGSATPEQCTFRRDLDYWTISFAGRVVRIPDRKGLHYLAPLLYRPGTRMHVAELQGAAAGGKRSRIPDDRASVERSRLTVSKGIQTALERISRAHPALGQHLAATVRRGYLCVYAPDPRNPIAWRG
jgi:hypothetical protein